MHHKFQAKSFEARELQQASTHSPRACSCLKTDGSTCTTTIQCYPQRTTTTASVLHRLHWIFVTHHNKKSIKNTTSDFTHYTIDIICISTHSTSTIPTPHDTLWRQNLSVQIAPPATGHLSIFYPCIVHVPATHTTAN